MEPEFIEESINNTPQTGSRIKSLFFKLIYLIVAVYLLLWIASPVIVRYFLGDYLATEYNITLLDESSVRYNPFTSHLSIDEFSLQKNDETVFHVNELDLEIRLHRLLMKQLFISEFEIEGIYVDVHSTSDGLQIAGFTLPTTESGSAESDLEDTSEDKKSSKYEVILPIFKFQNGKVALNQNGDLHTVEVLRLDILDAFISHNRQHILVDLKAKIDHAPLNANIYATLQDQQGAASVKLLVEKFNLENISQQLPQNIEILKGMINIESNLDIKIEKNNIAFSSKELQITVDDIEFKNDFTALHQANQTLTLEGFVANINKNSSEKNKLSILKLTLNGNMIKADVNGASLSNRGQTTIINNLSLHFLSEENLEIKTSDISIALLQLDAIQANMDFESDGIVININQLQFNPTELQIAHINVDGINGELQISKIDAVTKDKIQQSGNLDSIPHSGENKTDGEVKVKHQPAIKIADVTFTNSKSINFLDKSIAPTYERDIVISELNLKQLDSSLPNQQSPFQITGRSNQYTNFDFSGYLKPFTEKINLQLSGHLKEFSLPPANSYLQNFFGFQFESGELDTTLEITIKDSEIKGSTGILIRGLELSSAENYDQDSLQEQTAVPLNMALGLLKDNNGNVELDIPMLGNLDSPAFGFGSFVTLITQKAIQSAATSYLVKTFIPYAEIVKITVSAGSFLLKTRFEDLAYLPGQTEISKEQTLFIDKFVLLMKDKKNTRVKVCAISTTEDLAFMKANLKTEQDKIVILEDLSRKRMDLFKQHVVDKQIDSSRILLCSPKIDLSKDSKPRIEFSV